MDAIRTEIERAYIMENYIREESYLMLDKLNKTLAGTNLQLDKEGNIYRSTLEAKHDTGK